MFKDAAVIKYSNSAFDFKFFLICRYNDMSPLENHHCAVSFKILSSPECNIFANLSEEEFKEIRGVKSSVLNRNY